LNLPTVWQSIYFLGKELLLLTDNGRTLSAYTDIARFYRRAQSSHLKKKSTPAHAWTAVEISAISNYVNVHQTPRKSTAMLSTHQTRYFKMKESKSSPCHGKEKHFIKYEPCLGLCLLQLSLLTVF